MKVKYLNFKEQWLEDQKNLLPIIKEVFSSGQYVGSMNKRIIKLEENISKICNTKYCTTLNSGTDALIIGLHLMGIKKSSSEMRIHTFTILRSVQIHLLWLHQY